MTGLPFRSSEPSPTESFPDISFGADFFSFHTIVVTRDAEQITDLTGKGRFGYGRRDKSRVRISHRDPIVLPGVSLIKEFTLSDVFSYRVILYFKDLKPMSIRLGILTFLPGGFDRDRLFFETHNGGKSPENFEIGREEIEQDCAVNALVTASGCLGATEDLLTIGDDRIRVTVKTDKSLLYTVPMIRHHRLRDASFLRVYHSICERDDVANTFFKGYNEAGFDLI
ncbi:MAG: hypothetical protein M0C28_31995 [Candidatus Moduliflexus flocculans]|nr:hypothetical protein [Candidatus Moduliflexus flocculans]